jgi:methylmalonyl-CoA mutase N-terminal domain/subunit
VERLTDDLESAAQAYLDEIAAMGGAVSAIGAGFQQRHIQDAAFRVQREVERGERIVVGVNRFTDDEVVQPPLQRIDPALEHEQVARIRALRAERDAAAWGAALDELDRVARGRENVMPAIIGAVQARATLGEVSDRLRSVWGEHRELVTV